MATAARQGQQRSRFYVRAGLFVIALSIIGFGASNLDRSLRFGLPSPLVVAHGATVMAFLVLFTRQAWLVANGRLATHRKLGWVGAVLAVLIIVIGMAMSVATSRRGHDLSGDIFRAVGGPITPDAILIPALSFFNFGVLVGAAILNRHRPAIHKRLMLLAILQPMAIEPVHHLFGHIVGYAPGIQVAFNAVNMAAIVALLSVSAVHDRWTEGRIHPVSLWVPIALFVELNVMLGLVLPSHAWQNLANRLIH